MKKIVAGLAALAFLFPTAAHAETPSIVKQAHCKSYTPVSASDMRKYPGLRKSERKDAGTCKINGTKVYVITFKSKGQQSDWEFKLWVSYLPNEVWWNHGSKFVVMSQHGSKSAADAAVQRFGGITTNDWDN